MTNAGPQGAHVHDQAADFDNSGSIQGAELYAAILLVYNKVNKICPVHIKPPKKGEIKAIMKKHDMSEDGSLNREEFKAVVGDVLAGMVPAATITINQYQTGSSDSWHKTIWFRVVSSVALKLALFPAAGHGIQKGLSAAGFEAINKVPASVLAVGAEIVFKLGTMVVARGDD